MDSVCDAIEREIFIHASIQRVWSLVSRVGFWVGDELHFDYQGDEGDLVVIETENYGSFPVLVERLAAPTYAAYRWASGYPGSAPVEGNSTLVEFTLHERDGGVLVQVRESGFAKLQVAEAVRQSLYADNVGGWAAQLQALARVGAEVPV